MNALILGINGFLGSAIANRSVARGHKVFGMSRSETPVVSAGVTYLRGDRCDRSGLIDVIRQHKIDVLVDVIPMTLADTQPLIDCVDEQVGQYVMLSSIDVYRNYELLHRRSSGIPTHGIISEDSELRQTRFPYRGPAARAPDTVDRYLDDYDKIPIENRVRTMSSQWTILRLPMVYGEGDKQRRFRWAIKPMTDAEQTLVVPRSWASWCSTYGHVENVAEAITLTLGNTKAENRVFNVGEQPCLSQLEWATRFAAALAWSGEISQTDDPQDPFARGLVGLDLTIPLCVSSTRIREELGFKEIVDQGQALMRTVASEVG